MKTKVLFLFIALISVVIFSSCERKSGKKVKGTIVDTIPAKTISLSEHEFIVQRMRLDIKCVVDEKKNLEKFISNLKKNPEFFLFVLDTELSSAEKSEEPYGSFSDFFVPTINEALNAGVSRLEIQRRIDKLIQLANKGLFVSSYEEELFKDGGIKAIINYIGLNK